MVVVLALMTAAYAGLLWRWRDQFGISASTFRRVAA
jgi:hypothetical protein